MRNNIETLGVIPKKGLTPVLFYQGTRSYLFGLVRRDRFGTDLYARKDIDAGELNIKRAKRFGDGSVLTEFTKEYAERHRFYVIIRINLLGQRTYFASYSSTKLRKKPKAMFTRDIEKAYISASRKDIEETLAYLRVRLKEALMGVEEIYLTGQNEIQRKVFCLLMFDKEEQRMRYMSHYTKPGDVRSCESAERAMTLSYDDAVGMYEAAKGSAWGKRYQFAIIKKPEHNVDAKHLADYHKRHAVTGGVQIGFTLRSYQKKRGK